MRGDGPAVDEPDHAGGAVHLDGADVAGADHLGAELHRLAARALGELRPGDAVGEAQVVLDARALTGLPAGRGALDQDRAQALGRGVHRGAEAGRTTADHDHVVELLGGVDAQPDAGRQLGVAGGAQHLALRGDHDRDAVVALHLGGGQQPLALGLGGGVPPVGHPVAGQEVAHLERPRRPAVPDHLGLRHRHVVGGPPVLEQLVDDRVELLLRRVPGLEQVVVDVDEVDRLDRGVGVGVRREQHAAGRREDVHGLLEELDAVHLRHPVVGQDHRHLLAPQLQLAQRLQDLLAALPAHDPVVPAVLPPQVPRHRPRHARVVVDGDDRGATHGIGLGHPRILFSPSNADLARPATKSR